MSVSARAAVVGVGDELLAGIVVNTNAALIGLRLQGIGVPVAFTMCVGDDEDDIVAKLRYAIEQADVVVVTGGLGPTQDDRTREALARLMDAPLVRDEMALEAIRSRFTALGRTMAESNAKQADHPTGSTLVPNPFGTAPGIRTEIAGAVVYCLPGVPREAERMLDERVLPELVQRFEGVAVIRSRELRCVGIAESELADRLGDLADAEEPRMAFLPGGGEVRLRFVATGPAVEVCDQLLAGAEATVRERLGSAVFGVDAETLESVVGGLLVQRNLTIATAESCTAGLVSARLASVPGASAYLRGALVTYQDDVKARSLGIAPALIDAAGPVSGEVALEMARGVGVSLDADVGLAVTCSAGPTPQGAPIGATFIAIATEGAGPLVREVRIPGDRQQVRQFAATFALNLVRLYLLGEPLR